MSHLFSAKQPPRAAHTHTNTCQRKGGINQSGEWREWELDWAFSLWSSAVPLVEAQLTITCCSSLVSSSRTFSLQPLSYSQFASFTLFFPSFLSDRQIGVINIASPGTWKSFPLHTFSSPSTPLRHSTKRALTLEILKNLKVRLPFVPSHRITGQWKLLKEESGVVVLTSDKVPLLQGEQK